MRIHVLLVEDDAAISGLYAGWLGTGYACTAAASAGEALARLRRGRYDLLVLDYRLPDGSGLDVLERAREQGLRVPPVLLVTGYGSFGLSARAVDLGVSALAAKPLERAELLDKVAACLSCARRPRSASGDERLDRVLAFVAANLHRAFRVEELLAVACLSRSAFHRWLKRTRGQSYSQLVTELRLREVREQLASTERTLREIAARTGFSSASHLATWFKRHAGGTPSGFRRQLRRGPAPDAAPEARRAGRPGPREG